MLVLAPGREHGEVILFCQEREPGLEQWTGERMGPERAQQMLGVDDGFPISDLPDILPGLLEGRERVYANARRTSGFRSRPARLGEDDSRQDRARRDAARRVHRAVASAARSAAVQIRARTEVDAPGGRDHDRRAYPRDAQRAPRQHRSRTRGRNHPRVHAQRRAFPGVSVHRRRRPQRVRDALRAQRRPAERRRPRAGGCRRRVPLLRRAT